ncbi:MAG: hypothetical protein QM501_03575, partial [Gimesia sp.]
MDLIYSGKVTGALSQQLVETYSESLKDPIAAEQSKEFTKWNILYATNRLQKNNSEGYVGYGNEYGNTLFYGSGQINISRKNQSDLKTKLIQTIWQGAPGPEGKVKLSSVTPTAETLFYDNLNALLERS